GSIFRGAMDARRRSAPEEQVHPLFEQWLVRRHLRAERLRQGGLRAGRNDQELVAGMAEVHEPAGLRADECIAAQVLELALQSVVARLHVADLLAHGLSLTRDRVV